MTSVRPGMLVSIRHDLPSVMMLFLYRQTLAPNNDRSSCGELHRDRVALVLAVNKTRLPRRYAEEALLLAGNDMGWQETTQLEEVK